MKKSNPKSDLNRRKYAPPADEPLPKIERKIVVLGVLLALLLAIGFILFARGIKQLGTRLDSASSDSSKVMISPDYPRRLIDFSLVDQNNQRVTQKDFRGKFVVVGFVFTSCSITCPEVSHQMEVIQARTANQPDVRLISLTVNPVDDTVSVLKKYGARYGANPARWSFLTGDETIMRRLIGTSFLASDTTSQFAYMPGNFAHIERMALVLPDGRVARYFNGLNEKAADAVVAEIDRSRISSQ